MKKSVLNRLFYFAAAVLVLTMCLSVVTIPTQAVETGANERVDDALLTADGEQAETEIDGGIVQTGDGSICYMIFAVVSLAICAAVLSQGRKKIGG